MDLTSNITGFEVTFELNCLLLRNNKLIPSELVRKNLIFVARTKNPSKQPCQSVSLFPEVWQSILAMRSTHETFVVSFQLSLAKFTVDLSNVKDVVVIFKNDQSLEALQACDPQAISHVKQYVRRKLASEIKSIADFSIHITSPATILQNLPPLESTSKLEDIYHSRSIDLSPNQLVDASLTDIDLSCCLEKQLIFADDTDFDASDDELRILPSDDSAKGTVHEDDELDRLYSSDSLPCMDLASVLDLDIQGGIKNNVNGKSLDAISSEQLEAGFDECMETFNSRNTQFDDEIDELIAELESSPIRPPTAPHASSSEHGTLSKQPSLLYIDRDEKHGLDYAYRNKSPEIPKFIREDKKFKFIKVGKVQKFVNMFEEQKDIKPSSDGVSRGGSRVGTRPASPTTQ